MNVASAEGRIRRCLNRGAASQRHARGDSALGQSGQFGVILPPQLLSLRPHALARTGEYRLITAVLEEAVTCFQKHACARKKREQRLFDEVFFWIMRADRSGDAFSFEGICSVLGIDPSYLRGGLRRWLQAQRARVDGTCDGRVTALPNRARPCSERPALVVAQEVPDSVGPLDICSGRLETVPAG